MASGQAEAEPVEARLEVVVAVKGHRHQRGATVNAVARDKTEIAGVETVVAVVAHDEVVAGRDLNWPE